MVTYDGDVSPGGGPQTRDLGPLTLTKLAVDPEMSNNCYLLERDETGECVLIDAAAEPERLLALIGDRSLGAIVTTHQHFDHHRALADVKAAHPRAAVIAGEPDADAISEQTGVVVDRRVAQGDHVDVGGCQLSVIAIAGHTPGSIALHWDHGDGHLFTGDSLFPGGVGNTFGNADDFRTLINEVTAKIFGTYGDGVWFYPGHGGDSTLGAERPHLDEWRERGW